MVAIPHTVRATPRTTIAATFKLSGDHCTPSRSHSRSRRPSVVSASVRDGNYLQLRPQEPEQVLIGALQAPASP